MNQATHNPHVKKRNYLKKAEHRAITNQAESQQQNIFFSRSCVLPILDVTVKTIERSRDKFDPLTPTLMGLIQANVNTLEKLGAVLVVDQDYLKFELIKMLNSGWLDENNELLSLSPLGQRCFETNQAHSEVEKRLRICAITGALLPRAAYDYPIIHAEGLASQFKNFLHYLPELEFVPLDALDITQIENKQSYNISDETIEISEVVEYEGAFQEGRLVSIGNNEPTQMFVAFKYDLTHDVSKTHLNTWLRLEKKQIYDSLKERLAEHGIGDIDKIDVSEFGLVRVYLKHISKNFLSTIQIPIQEAGVSALGINICGTDKFLPRPLHKYPHGIKAQNGVSTRDCLKGFSMYVYALDREQKAEIDIQRELDHEIGTYLNMPVYQRSEATLEEYLVDKFGIDFLTRAQAIAEKYNLKNVLKTLKNINFEAIAVEENEEE